MLILIDLREHVVDHVGVGVDVHRPIQRIREAQRVGVAELGVRIVAVDLARKSPE